ncbi:hypothetical protein [Hyphomicrobium sp.]|uniref:hypothetical protein n=1 Tax=Hyphomicrobium sp. TaxID=82 RepID=UPI000FA2C2ED|nr:hypothetical protein [Hyphomicrobium sp.]RUP07393.1 MAG: hypothetical protein EKK38_19740 [Hyphomicrobium sp.]
MTDAGGRRTPSTLRNSHDFQPFCFSGEDKMQPTQETKQLMRLLSVASSSIGAGAFPALLTPSLRFDSYSFHQVDNRTYRHCHNHTRFVYCVRKAGEPRDAVIRLEPPPWMNGDRLIAVDEPPGSLPLRKREEF